MNNCPSAKICERIEALDREREILVKNQCKHCGFYEEIKKIMSEFVNVDFAQSYLPPTFSKYFRLIENALKKYEEKCNE